MRGIAPQPPYFRLVKYYIHRSKEGGGQHGDLQRPAAGLKELLGSESDAAAGCFQIQPGGSAFFVVVVFFPEGRFRKGRWAVP